MGQISLPSVRSAPRSLRGFELFAFAGMLLGAAGCGDAPAPGDFTAHNASAEQPVPLQLASAELPAGEHAEVRPAAAEQIAAPPRTPAGPAVGTAEWFVQEAARLRALPPNVVLKPVAGKLGEFEHVQIAPELVAQERLRRSEKIIDYASQAVAQTAGDPSQQQLFNNAIHLLADARLERGLEGDHDQAQLLGSDAEFLYEKFPGSFAAIETAYRVLQLTYTQAQKYGDQEPRWTLALARQARLFAQRFPQEGPRASMFLVMAGQLCDQQGLADQARVCLTLVSTQFPNTPFASQAADPLRRLNLPGQVLSEFGGSTRDGGFVEINRLRGKFVLIAFWESSSAKFESDLPAISRSLASQAGRVVPVGVCLDQDESACDQFLARTGLDWPQIFSLDPAKRGPQNPVARLYAVAAVPSYWLVGPDGVVRSIDIDPAKLDELLAASAATP